MSRIRIFMPCEEASQVCDKVQYKEASLWEKIKLNLHVVLCMSCRKHTKVNTKLSECIKKSNIDCLDPKCKEVMKKTLDKALKNYQS
ncbi:hypothetical protein F6U93_10660 [Tamlana haliotis]|uniref:Glycine dehydrogenase n=1 Tax=Pseudotamlana haliotis TaxID=2614804 RepID=A0A6N6MBB1_9FLAO|nr:hypothetical protein [Tamlana haliotis]KAB1067500.1 hypothetical protein F6U93_10660 [Tamlana haliotis]